MTTTTPGDDENPIIMTMMMLASPPAGLSGSVRPVGVRIYQPYAVFASESYQIAGGRAERRPALGAMAKSVCKVRSYSTTAGIQDALSVDLGATRRWLPDPDLWSDGFWSPSVGSDSVRWKGATTGDGSKMYIDAAYDYDSRLGPLDRNAFVFPGNAWLASTGKMCGPGETWALSLVAVFHGNDLSTRATIINSFQDNPDDPDDWHHDTGKQDLCLDIDGGDKLVVRTGGRQTYDTLHSVSDRPVIVVLSGTGRTTRALVVDRKYASHHFRHPDVGPTDMRLLLGRPNVSISPKRGSARMDLLEIATWNGSLSPHQMREVANKLDSVYGVSG